MNLESCWEVAKAFRSEPWYFPSLFPHSQSAHRHTKWRPSPPLTARMENLSLASMGDPVLDLRGHPWNQQSLISLLPQAHIPETKSSWLSLLFDMPHSPCSTTLCMQAGHWGIPRSSRQPNQLPHHTHRMGSRSEFPSLKSSLLHAELMQGCKILESHWNTQGICFP